MKHQFIGSYISFCHLYIVVIQIPIAQNMWIVWSIVCYLDFYEASRSLLCMWNVEAFRDRGTTRDSQSSPHILSLAL